MAGILLASGQTWIVTQMADQIATLGGLYIGLMNESSNPSEGSQIGAGITELDPTPAGSGYSRQFSVTWVNTSGVDPQLSGEAVTFIVSGSWASTNGYFVSLSSSGNDALWAEAFSVSKQGTKNAGDRITVSPMYQQKYDGEA